MSDEELNYQSVTVSIYTDMNNKAYQAGSLTLKLNNKYLNFGRAVMKVQTVLEATDMVYGFRYFLYTFFFTFALVGVSVLTFFNSVLILGLIYIFNNSTCKLESLCCCFTRCFGCCCCFKCFRNFSFRNKPSTINESSINIEVFSPDGSANSSPINNGDQMSTADFSDLKLK